ncbi:MAG: hydroxyacid dehydrogenase, partial [Pseudonocardia sp.]
MAERITVVDHPKAALAMDPRLAPEVFPDDVVERLRRVVHFDPVARTDLDGIADVEILLTGWSCPRIDADVLDRARRLRAVIHAAGTVKGHIGPEVFARGVTVSAASEANARPVAEFTVAAMVLAAKRAFLHARRYTRAEPEMSALPHEDSGLVGQTVGIVGASRVGRMVLERLAPFDVRVLVSDPYLDRRAAGRLGAELVDLDDLFRRADMVSLHAPRLPETDRLVDARRLALLRDGAVVINTARGSLVDTDALTRGCGTGRISAVLDVTDPEPLPPSHPLLGMPHVFVTPHIAGSRGRELRRMGEFAVAEVERLVRGEPLRGLVR